MRISEIMREKESYSLLIFYMEIIIPLLTARSLVDLH